MHVNSDDDPVEIEVKGKLTISCVISKLPKHNYKVTRRLMMDCAVKEGLLSYLIWINFLGIAGERLG